MFVMIGLTGWSNYQLLKYYVHCVWKDVKPVLCDDYNSAYTGTI